ncbi:MAG: hypothetical protein JST75_22340 [Bacteroidetes bacterium]|nr:hypothetical protein [Bacteroidota bacterium]
MEKNFYKIAMLLFVCGLISVSCKKENTAPTSTKQQTATNAKTSGDVGSSTPATAYQQTAPPGCPGHK